MTREYYSLGVVTSETTDGTMVTTHARVTLLMCSECGSVVSGGRGQNRHNQWHVTLAGAIDGVPTDLPY